MKDIHTRTPVNRMAARVVGGGVHFNPSKKINNIDSELPLKITEITKQNRICPTFDDLTGKRVGRFTVIGLAADAKGMWVVRCDCGRYSMRRKKSILNHENTQDRCEHCRHLAQLKRTDVWRRTGKNVDIREF